MRARVACEFVTCVITEQIKRRRKWNGQGRQGGESVVNLGPF